MKSRRPAYIEEKRPVYIGCEGTSEFGYAALLQDMLRDPDMSVHLVIRDLGKGAGDPLARIEKAVQYLKQNHSPPTKRFVLLDSDQVERDPQRANQARSLAAVNNITIIWQSPCFEAMLLRHLEGCTTRRPPDTGEAGRALNREWRNYKKPMSRASLSQRIDRAAVLRAASVEPGLSALLRCLGLMVD